VNRAAKMRHIYSTLESCTSYHWNRIIADLVLREIIYSAKRPYHEDRLSTCTVGWRCANRIWRH